MRLVQHHHRALQREHDLLGVEVPVHVVDEVRLEGDHFGDHLRGTAGRPIEEA
jgi:hypothetical protein